MNVERMWRAHVCGATVVYRRGQSREFSTGRVRRKQSAHPGFGDCPQLRGTRFYHLKIHDLNALKKGWSALAPSPRTTSARSEEREIARALDSTSQASTPNCLSHSGGIKNLLRRNPLNTSRP